MPAPRVASILYRTKHLKTKFSFFPYRSKPQCRYSVSDSRKYIQIHNHCDDWNQKLLKAASNGEKDLAKLCIRHGAVAIEEAILVAHEHGFECMEHWLRVENSYLKYK